MAAGAGTVDREADVGSALDVIALDSLRPVAWGLAGLYAFFGAAHVVFQPPHVALVVSPLAAFSAACYGMLALALAARPPPARFAHATGAGMAALVLVNVGTLMALVRDPLETTSLMLLAVGAGLLFLSARWLAVVLALAVATFAAAAATSAPAREWTHFGFALVTSIVLALLLHVVRVRTYRRLERQRIDLEATTAAARESEERLRTVVTGAPVILFAFDRDGVITVSEGSGLAALGLGPSEVVGRSIFEMYAGDEAALRAVRRALDGDEFTDHYAAGGVTLETRFVPVRDASGEVRRVIAVSTDVTDRVRAEAELAASRRQVAVSDKLSALGTLVASVAHEVNNPLAFMKGTVEMTDTTVRGLAERGDIPEDVRDALAEVREDHRIVLDGVERIARITQNLKTVARAGSRDREPEDVNGIVDSVLAVARPRLGKGVRVECDLAASRLALASGSEVLQVVLNLVLNAADAMADREDATLRVRSRDAAERVILEVEDSGCGIRPEDAARVFMPFFTTKPQGTGLGLSVSHRIVEDHGGRLTFTSTPGVGTTFRVELPVAPAGAVARGGAVA